MFAASPAEAGKGGGTTAHRMHIEVRWDAPVPIRVELSGGECSGNLPGQPYPHAIMSATDTTNTITNCRVSIDVENQRGTFDIDAMTEPCYAIMAWDDGACGARTNIWADWYVDGCLVARGSTKVNNCYRDGVGAYQEGQSCLPQLYVDVDNNFDPSNHSDDLSRYVPGSTLDGTSIAPASMPQAVRLVAVGSRNVSGTVNFELVPGSVSRFPGLAMNYPIDSPDVSDDVYFMVLKDPRKPSSGLIKATTASASMSNGVASTTLYVNDYAACASVKATIPTGKQSPPVPVTIRLPRDENGNLLPDAGWLAGGRTVASVGLYPPDDDDETPPGSGLPVEGVRGDGLTAFEEYRGAVVQGAHWRLDPAKKDLFVLLDQQTAAFAGGLGILPLAVHLVTDAEAEPAALTPQINVNTTTAMPGSVRFQAAVRVIEQTNSTVTFQQADSNIVPAWTRLAGKHWTLQEDLCSTFELPQGLERMSPNETLRIDIYPRKLANKALFFGGNPQPPLLGDDIIDPRNPMMLILPGNNNILESQPASPGDFRAELLCPCGIDCDLPPGNVVVVNVATTPLGTTMRETILAHEVMHSIDVEHGVTCGDLMFFEYDRIPFAQSPDPNETSQIRVQRRD